VRFVPFVVFVFSSFLHSGCVLIPTLRGAPPKLDLAAAREARWQDLRGIVHCHSYLSHDSKGTLEEITEAANGAGVRFIAMTDHFTPRGVNEGARGLHEGVLFMTGVELSRDGGSILGLGIFDAVPTATAYPPVQDFSDGSTEAIAEIHRAGGLAFIGHAEDYRGWDARGWDGVEIHNLHADASRTRWWTYLGYGLFTPPSCFFTRMIDHPRDVLARWDALCKTRRVPGVGGCDCHANVSLFGPLGGTIGTYKECFRAVTTHVLLEQGRPVSATAICEALRAGRCYVAFEIGGDATGFDFSYLPDGLGSGESAVRQGGEAAFRRGGYLVAYAPGGRDVRLDLIRDGAREYSSDGGELRFPLVRPGVYRVEAYLDGDLFVLSNPIYVR
jgi:predicted metal-dependent phosphoesterase TrpH